MRHRIAIAAIKVSVVAALLSVPLAAGCGKIKLAEAGPDAKEFRLSDGTRCASPVGRGGISCDWGRP